MNLADAKHAFITGGASGIGLGIAEALAGRGIAVTIADVDRPALQSVVTSRSGKWRSQEFDTRDRKAWATAKAEAEAAFGPVDILINNAGIGPDGRDLADMNPESFDRVVSINLVGVFNGVSAFAADLRARWSHRQHVVHGRPGLWHARRGCVHDRKVRRCRAERNSAVGDVAPRSRGIGSLSGVRGDQSPAQHGETGR